MDSISWKNGEDLFQYGTLSDLEEMASYLIENGFEDAGVETLHLLYTIKQAKIRADVMASRLSKVWKAAEKNESGDWGKSELEKAIKEYRGENNGKG